MRQIILDTETTGLDPKQGHRIIEIGCVEMVNRRITRNNYHVYINPQREIDAGAIKVHGITNEILADKPLFAEIAAEFCAFIKDADLIIHNAPFDIGFLDMELKRARAGLGKVKRHCREVIDTLVLARKMHPGQRNSLDALCKRYGIDNSHRDLHGALLDSEILADVYLGMTGGQTALSLEGETQSSHGGDPNSRIKRLSADRPPLTVVEASRDEIAAHSACLDVIDKASDGHCLWKNLS